MIEHHIQRDILRRLTHAAALRFSELKPEGMESNIFMYHLKQLIKEGYVQKTENAYSLAAPGLSYVDSLSTENHRPRQQPKLIAIIALRHESGAWLLAERKIQPYIGTRMFISGKQHRGETAAEHATRELAEKTGLEGIELARRGIADVQIFDAEKTLLTHAVATVYEGIIVEQIIPKELERLRFVWHDFEKSSRPLMPGTREIYEHLKLPGEFDLTIRAVSEV